MFQLLLPLQLRCQSELGYYSNGIDDPIISGMKVIVVLMAGPIMNGDIPNEPYYFDTNSGVAYSSVDFVFPTNGFGNTRSYTYGY